MITKEEQGTIVFIYVIAAFIVFFLFIVHADDLMNLNSGPVYINNPPVQQFIQPVQTVEKTIWTTNNITNVVYITNNVTNNITNTVYPQKVGDFICIQVPNSNQLNCVQQK